mmetsp:Transcript_36512/g.36106  ORF Transcript_36512/g.36106 Transcript_36512/m.36106 type:complete len:235 (+) Transcript_36512:342-1046(+)
MQRKKLHLQKFENEKMLKKIDVLKLNYETLSNSAKKDKEEYLKLKLENDKNLSEIDKLKEENVELGQGKNSTETQCIRYREEINRITNLNKEMEEELKKANQESDVKTEEIKKIHQASYAQKEDIAKKDNQITDLTKQLAKLKEELESTIANSVEVKIFNEIRSENEALRSSVEQLTKQMKADQGAYEQQLAQVRKEAEEQAKKVIPAVDAGQVAQLKQEHQELQNKFEDMDIL